MRTDTETINQQYRKSESTFKIDDIAKITGDKNNNGFDERAQVQTQVQAQSQVQTKTQGGNISFLDSTVNDKPLEFQKSSKTNERPLSCGLSNGTSYVVNVQKVIDKNAIIVETNYPNKKFMFYDQNKNLQGGFSIYDFIKYITSNVSSEFLKGVDSASVRPIIEKYICNVTYIEKPCKRYVINMHNHLESPFMGNIETLIKLYSFIHDFEENNLQDELIKISEHDSSNVTSIFNDLLYCLLNHILRIIVMLTNKLSPNDNPTVKELLLNYSVAIVYRLSKFVKTEIDEKVGQINILNQDLLRIEGVRTSLITKLDSVQRSIDKQNAEIDIILRNMFVGIGNISNLRDVDASAKGKLKYREESIEGGSDISSQSQMSTIESSATVSDCSSLDKSHIYELNNESTKNLMISNYLNSESKSKSKGAIERKSEKTDGRDDNNNLAQLNKLVLSNKDVKSLSDMIFQHKSESTHHSGYDSYFQYLTTSESRK